MKITMQRSHQIIFLIILINSLVACRETEKSHHDDNGDDNNNNNNELADFLEDVNKNLTELFNKEVEVMWLAETRGHRSIKELFKIQIAATNVMEYLRNISDSVAYFNRTHIKDEYLKRQLMQIPEVGYDALNELEMDEMYEVIGNMSDVYGNVKLCSFADPNVCDLKLFPDVQNIIHTSNRIDEIEYYWSEWRRKTGIRAREPFEKFIQLFRKTALLNGFSQPSNFWYKDVEQNSTEVLKLAEELMYGLRPLFQQLHAHVRGALRQEYGPNIIKFEMPYPQNLAEVFIANSYRDTNGSWAMKFPYPEADLANITSGLLKRDLDMPEKLFLNAVEYFRGIGMPALEDFSWEVNAKPKFDSNSPKNSCWHKAWKYYGGISRVNFSYCPNTDKERFFNMFEAVSDIYYAQAYRNQPTLFQEEPVPNFSDALGKVFSLAVSSPKYLERVGITSSGYTSYEARINRLYVQGLQKIFLIPVFYVLDRYRVEVMDGEIDILDNCAYWDLTETYTGAQSPIKRSKDDFDAPAKLLMEVDDQYTSQLMSIVLEFQIYKHFCLLTGQYKRDDPNYPLDLCDLSEHPAIGSSIYQAMALGSSKSYKDVLYVMIGETKPDISGLLEYFQPLYDWLDTSNRETDSELGWKESKRMNIFLGIK